MSSAALAWLVTWTWQAAALTLVSTAVLRFARTNATTRYLAWWITLVGVLALAVMPWSWPLAPEYISASAGGSPAAPLGVTPGGSRFGLVEIPPVPLWILGVSAASWAVYSAWQLIALARSLTRLRVVKRHCVPVSAPLEERLPLWMSVRHEGRSAQVCVSEDVATGCMLGLGAPVIALPPGLVAALTDADLDRIVLHEFGHVQRLDDWTTFAQASIEALIGWHPAVLWIGRSLRLEREVACDDRVILHTSAPHDYASSLTKVAGLALTRPALPVALRALRSRRELIQRVERLLDPMRNVSIRPIRSVLATGTFALGSVVVLLGQTPPVVTVGAAAALPVVTRLSQRLGTDPQPLLPLVASGRVGLGTGRTKRTGGPMARTSREGLSPPPRIVNQARLLEHAELNALRGLTPPASLRPALVARQLRPVLRSSELGFDAEPALPMNLPFRKPAGFRTGYMATDTGESLWRPMAAAGRAVGIGASHAGVASAVAFRAVGSSLARVFVGNR